MPLLAAIDGGKQNDPFEPGTRLLEDVFDLIRQRLPGLRPDDPVRQDFAEILPGVGRDLGRPALMRVPPERMAGG